MFASAMIYVAKWKNCLSIYISLLYCSPIIFPGLLNKDFASIKKCICLLSTSSGVAYTRICKVVISQHFNSCTRLSTSIINNPFHPPLLRRRILLMETPSSLAWHVFLLTRNKKSIYHRPIFPT